MILSTNKITGQGVLLLSEALRGRMWQALSLTVGCSTELEHLLMATLQQAANTRKFTIEFKPRTMPMVTDTQPPTSKSEKSDQMDESADPDPEESLMDVLGEGAHQLMSDTQAALEVGKQRCTAAWQSIRENIEESFSACIPRCPFPEGGQASPASRPKCD